MVRILGNSSERVPLLDLKDVVYYRQIKDYTDQEYEVSRDLKKEIARGRLTLLSRSDPLRGTVVGQESSSTSNIQASDLRSALREILPELQGSSPQNLEAKDVAREMAPIVADLVRQEMSRMSFSSGAAGGAFVSKTPTSSFMGPEYIPTVTTEGMISNVEAKTIAVSGNTTNDALAALRKMQSGK